jgi:photosystem II stability/assembly factor-like uncharacterized protein
MEICFSSWLFNPTYLDAMKHFGKFCLVALLLVGSTCRAQWDDININPDKYAVALNFITDDLGYALMVQNPFNQRTIEKTTDGGATWTPLTVPNAGELQDVDFSANGVGVLVLRDLQSSVAPTKVFQTTNDGTSWQDISPDSTATGIGTAVIQFLDVDTGFMASGERIHATFDGGATWTTTTIIGYPQSMDFVDGMHGVIGLFDGSFAYTGGMMTTTDGGATWTTTWLTDWGTVIGEVGQWTTTRAYAAPAKWGSNSQSRFFTTTNNGVSWDTVAVPDTLPDGELSDIHFLDPLNGVIAVSSFTRTVLYETTDGGSTWTMQDTLPYFDITDLELTAHTGYIGGDQGKIWKLDVALGAVEPGPVRDGQLGLFPNPVAVGTSLRWGSTEAFDAVRLVDVAGRVVWQGDLRGYLRERGFMVPPVCPGLYVVELSGAGMVRMGRVLVE